MHTTLFSTAYFPPIEYFIHICQSEKIVIEQYENYLKQSYRNRYCIIGANGRIDLSIPVNKTTGNHTLIKDITIDYSTLWTNIHWRTLESNYNKSPFFIYYKDDIQLFYNKNFTTLLEYNTEILKVILKFLKLPKEIILTKDYDKSPKIEDLRYSMHPKKSSAMFFPEYMQVFSDKFGFTANLSILDLLFNLGPDSLAYLQQTIEK